MYITLYNTSDAHKINHNLYVHRVNKPFVNHFMPAWGSMQLWIMIILNKADDIHLAALPFYGNDRNFAMARISTQPIHNDATTQAGHLRAGSMLQEQTANFAQSASARCKWRTSRTNEQCSCSSTALHLAHSFPYLFITHAPCANTTLEVVPEKLSLFLRPFPFWQHRTAVSKPDK